MAQFPDVTKVVGIEHIKELNDFAFKNFDKDLPEEVKSKIELHTADGRLGWPKDAPYSAIHGTTK
jgi:protein-L-isoaspartate(D-aspartate) O-methyltransferase